MGWQVCLAHQLRDCQYAIEAGDSVFAPRMKAVLLRAVVLANMVEFCRFMIACQLLHYKAATRSRQSRDA